MRTPLALLGSLGLCLALQWRGIEFDPRAWFLIDFAVIAVIASAPLKRVDWAIVALFVPAWVAYFLPPEPRFFVALAAVVTQLLLTIPLPLLRRLVTRWKANFRHRDEWTNLESRESHG